MAAAVTLIACGGPSSSSSTASTTPAPTGASSSGTPPPVTSSATPVTSGNGDPQLLPLATDTPYQQAPAAIQAEWQSYFAQGIVTVVPNSTVPSQRPPTPTVRNATAGAVDDATARRWADALMRQTAWATWAINHNQLQLLYETSSREAYPGLALPEGATGLQIQGSQFPSAMKLVKVSAGAQSILHVSEQYAFVVTLSMATNVIASFPDGHTQVLANQSYPAGTTAFITGVLTPKPLLGDIWFGTWSGACDNGEPTPLQQLCNE